LREDEAEEARPHFPNGTALLSPRRKYLLYFAGDSIASGGAIHSTGEQLVVFGVVVANRGGNRQSQRVFFQIPARL
jgi:hypothetical protein